MGDYLRDGTVHDLTPEHIQRGPGSVAVDAPAGTSEVRVDGAYLRDSLGNFAADHAFTEASGSIVVASDEVTFTTFAPGPDQVFTVGSDASLRFLARPMWVAVESIENGVEISAHDGDTTGQDIRLDKEWLSEFGVTTPIAVHENGTVLDISDTVDAAAFIVDVPHFSGIKIINPDLDQSWMTEGFTLFYDANGVDESSDFKITVTEITASDIRFHYWATVAGNDNVFKGETFDLSSRESLNRSEYYSLNYVNNDELLNGEATLSLEQYDLTLVSTNAYIFTRSGGDLEYHFDIDQGWLRKVEDNGNGASIVITAWSSSVSYPTQNPPDAVATLTQTPIEGGATWDVFAPEGLEASAYVNPPLWSGGDSDETVAADILDDRTIVEARMEYSITAHIRGLEACQGEDIDCQALAHTKEFHIHWDDSSGTTFDLVICPDGNGPCGESSSLDEALDQCAGCSHSLTGSVEHDSCTIAGLLCEGSVGFWVCAHGFVFEQNNIVDQAHMSGCPFDPGAGRPYHPGHPGSPHGLINVDPFENLQ